MIPKDISQSLIDIKMKQAGAIKSILVIASIFCLIFSQQRPPIDQNSKAFSGVFSLNWTAGYCYAMAGTQNQCDPQMLKLWDSKSFSIHGLWPSSQTHRTYQDFNLSYVKQDKKLINQMWNLWAPQTNYPLKGQTAQTFDHYWLWQHEFNKHGKDFVNILQVLYPQKSKNASNKLLQDTYFSQALAFYEQKFKGLQRIPQFSQKTHFMKTPESGGKDFLINKEDLSKLSKVPASNFLAKCQKDDVLSQIHFCWRIQPNTGLYSINCKIIQNETIYPLTDSCPENFKLLSYGKYGLEFQKRVWRKPSQKKLKTTVQIINLPFEENL